MSLHDNLQFHASSRPLRKEEKLWDRALDAFRCDPPEPESRSCFSQNERFCMLTNLRADAENDAKGIEFILEFPDANETTEPNVVETPVELRVDEITIFDGTWRTSFEVDGQTLEPCGTWETVCVDAAKHYGYCERSLSLSKGRRLLRRLFLAYNESTLLLADELVPSDDDRKEPTTRKCRSTFPLAGAIDARPDPLRREILLTTSVREPVKVVSTTPGKRSRARSEEEELLADIEASAPASQRREKTLARLFPIALPEMRSNQTGEGLDPTEGNGSLCLTRLSHNASLFSPLMLDLNPRRAARESSWRPLTIGENHVVAAPENAFGRKLQLGNEQYVLYASTSKEPAVRSILGRHLISDFMFGKFLAAKGVVPILDVELCDDDES